ncbi:hypothetical protein CEXT_790671 [Caerostris extrusa]|uniref:Uncharacterized protein n=1 Tax=Caerostris extrusa TaxID=172846 RepID=A0AAV4VU99_CAEEX|nr:hypothetical protein CEXT_790671 [Caerostris extrusa]
MLKSLEALVNLNSGLIKQATEFPSSKSRGERSATLSKYEDTLDSVAQVIREPKLIYLWPHALLKFRDECPPVLLLSLTGPHANVIEAIVALNPIAVR